ncbi:MAG TPA: ribosome-associated translation inhibitor RaiA [Thermoanaerobaculia bacterium]|nr:ribosome-associated translation inhibitor RaiA [Thermoanaerobaculia bacterium]
MKIDYTCRNFHLDDRLRKFVEQKVQKVVKFVDEPIEVKVTLDVEKHRYIAELHIHHRLGVVQATEETDGNMQEAINLAIEKAEKQARRSRKKLVDKRRRGERNGQRWPVAVLERDSIGTGAPRIIESTHLPIKPMTIDEAALELEISDHGFVVFRDATSDRLNVLYRRKDDNYGLIAPDEP